MPFIFVYWNAVGEEWRLRALKVGATTMFLKTRLWRMMARGPETYIPGTQGEN